MQWRPEHQSVTAPTRDAGVFASPAQIRPAKQNWRCLALGRVTEAIGGIGLAERLSLDAMFPMVPMRWRLEHLIIIVDADTHASVGHGHTRPRQPDVPFWPSADWG
jgi:hypothetical protein